MIDFTKYLYESLPAIYRLEDAHQSFTLKKYLEVLGDYLNFVCNETEGILGLYDVDKMPVNFLKRYASLFDFPLYDDMPEDVQRKLLGNLVPILKRKGTKEVIEFVAREVTGCDASVTEGDSRVFMTWSDPLKLPIGYNVPVTFEPTQGVPYKYCGSIDTDRFTIYVSIISNILGNTMSEEELREKEGVLRKYLKDLVPSYLNLVFTVTARDETEEGFDEETVVVADYELTQNDVLDCERTYGVTQYVTLDTYLDTSHTEDVNPKIEYEHLDFAVESVGHEYALVTSKEEFNEDTPI